MSVIPDELPTLGTTDVTQPYSITPLYVIGGALAFTAGLAWNNAIQSIIKRYNPIDTSGGSIWAKLMYAVAVTVLVILLVYVLNYLNQQSMLLEQVALAKWKNLQATGSTIVQRTL